MLAVRPDSAIYQTIFRLATAYNTPAPCPENRAGFSSGIPWIKFGKTEQLLHAQNSVNLLKFKPTCARLYFPRLN